MFLICIFLSSNIGKSSLEHDKWRRAASVFYVIHNLGLAVSGWLIVQPEQLGPGDLLSSPPRQIPTKPRTSADAGWYVVIYLHVKVFLSIHSIHTIQSRNLEFVLNLFVHINTFEDWRLACDAIIPLFRSLNQAAAISATLSTCCAALSIPITYADTKLVLTRDRSCSSKSKANYPLISFQGWAGVCL